MITLNNINKYFNHHKKNELHVINNTSLELGDVGLVSLLGPSGSGKTTLLNCIGGLDKWNSGTLVIDNKKITKKNYHKMDKIRNLNIGYVFQDYKLIDEWTVFDNVAIALKMCGIKDKEEINRRVSKVLEIVELYRYRKRPAAMLSGGERQRVGIARAIVKNPSIIICDEPTGNLDSRNSIEIMNIIKSISQEKLVILVTHEEELANLYADRIIKLEDGKIISDEVNDKKTEIDYDVDGKIYLKDLKNHEKIANKDLDINFYSDKKAKCKLSIVLKNNTLYIESDKPIEKVDGESAFEIIDAHYKKINKSIYEKYKFDNEEIKDKTNASLYNIFNLLSVGFKKVKKYSTLKKVGLLSYFIAGAMIVFCLSTIISAKTIHYEDFDYDDHTYIQVKTNDGYNLLNKVNSLDNINYMLPSSLSFEFEIPIDDFYQLEYYTQTFSASLASSTLITESDLIKGKLPDIGEVVIDKRIFDSINEDSYNYNSLLLVNINEYDKLLGRKIKVGDNVSLTIVGITDKVVKEIFVNESDMIRVIAENDDYSDLSNTGISNIYYYKDNIELTKGDMPKMGEVIVPDELKFLYPLNKAYPAKLADKELNVVGYYKSDKIKDALINEESIEYYLYKNSNTFTISSKEKQKTIEDLTKSGIMASDLYKNNYDEYVRERKESADSTIVATSIILGITLIEIFFVIRASFTSRIKEVGTLRAIGVKKSDIYKMFSGEIIVSTTLAGLSGIIFCYAFINALSDIKIIGRSLSSNPFIIILAAIILYIFNVVIGLIPVYRTIKKTPAEILSRKDI